MKLLNLGIELDQGADFSLVLGIFDSTGVPLNLTGYSFKSQMRASTDPAGSPVAEFQFEILDQVSKTGQVRWYLPQAASADIATTVANGLERIRPTTPFVFDIKMKDTSNVITRIAQGLIFISPQATQEPA